MCGSVWHWGGGGTRVTPTPRAEAARSARRSSLPSIAHEHVAIRLRRRSVVFSQALRGAARALNQGPILGSGFAEPPMGGRLRGGSWNRIRGVAQWACAGRVPQFLRRVSTPRVAPDVAFPARARASQPPLLRANYAQGQRLRWFEP